MSYEATVFNVMIASPGDVGSERAIVREVIAEWNVIHSARRRIVLLPTDWETHSSPEMGTTPQAIINKQILDKSDLLIGVFWTRIGTQTAEYASGSVEEIERHISSGKPVMLYFSTQPARLDSVDDDQYSELKKFRESCEERGLYETYDSLSAFKKKLYRQLQIKLNEDSMFVNVTQNESEPSSAVVDSEYRLPELSKEARILLKEASQDEHGAILFLRYIGGTGLQTNSKDLIEEKNRRSIAKWEAALKQLVEEELVVERDRKGELFEITELGYQIAELVEL